MREAARAGAICSGGALVDLEKAHGRIARKQLIASCMGRGFSFRRLRFSFAADMRGKRVIKMGHRVSRPFEASSSIAAGGSRAAALLKVVNLFFDAVMRKWPRAGLALMVGDGTLQADGSAKFAREVLADHARYLRRV